MTRSVRGLFLAAAIVATQVELVRSQRPALSTYSVVAIGTLGGDSSTAAAVNVFGEVVGAATTADGATHAFLYRNRRILDLGTLPGGRSSYATAINDRGDVVGYGGINAYGPQFPEFSQGFVWQDGTMRSVGALYCPCSFNIRYGTSHASAISDDGWVVGDAQADRQTLRRAFVWNEGAMSSLDLDVTSPGDAHAYGINDIHEIVGDANGHAFLWRDGRRQDLGALAGYLVHSARAVNKKGEVVGNAVGVAGLTRGFRWDLGTMRALEPLQGDPSSQANAINVLGDIVGRSGEADFSRARAVLWHNGLAIDLSRLIAASGWTLVNATGINDLGKIVGVGTRDKQTRALLLTAD